MDSTCGNIPGIVSGIAYSFGKRICRNLFVGCGGFILAVNDGVYLGSAVICTGSGGSGCACVKRSVRIGINRRIRGIVVSFVLLGGSEVCVGIACSVLCCFVGIVSVEPEVGVELVVAVFYVMRKVFCICCNALDGDLVDLGVKTCLVNKTDGRCCTCDRDAAEIARFGKRNIVCYCRDERCGNRESYRHFARYDVFTYSYGCIEHIVVIDIQRLICVSEESVGAVDIGSIERGIFLDALMPEANKIVIGIGIPTDVVAVCALCGIISKLTVLASHRDKGSSCIS